jgi:hypothetical protein
MSAITLYDINEMYAKCLDEANAYGEEHGGETDPALEMKLEALGMARESKIENCLRYIKNISAEAEAVELEKKRLASRQVTIENRIEWMKKYLGAVVGVGNKIKLACGTIGWRPSTSTEIIDSTAIPAKYKSEKIEISIDKKAIKADIEAGQDVPGAKLNQNNNIQIK